MMDTQASLRYAHALFGLAKEKKELEKVDQDFVKLMGFLEQHREISHLVLNSTISRIEIEDLIEKIFAQEISRTLMNFIKVLIRKSRFDQIQLIQSKFHKLFENEQGVREVCAITAAPLSKSARTKLLSALEKKMDAKIRLIENTDSKMIGGMILRFDGQEINTSYRDRLNELKQILTQ